MGAACCSQELFSVYFRIQAEISGSWGVSSCHAPVTKKSKGEYQGQNLGAEEMGEKDGGKASRQIIGWWLTPNSLWEIETSAVSQERVAGLEFMFSPKQTKPKPNTLETFEMTVFRSYPRGSTGSERLNTQTLARLHIKIKLWPTTFSHQTRRPTYNLQ